MSVLRQLSAEAVETWISASVASMAAHAPGIDRLDERPLGDATCGAVAAGEMAAIGLALDRMVRPATLTAIADAIERGRSAAADVPRPPTTGSARAATVLGAWFEAFADLARNADALTAGQVALAIELAADTAAERLGVPGPPAVALLGAMASAALGAADADAALGDLVVAVAEAGLDELERAATADETLLEAGVVDPVSASLLVVVDALVATVHGEPPELPAWEFPERWEFAEDPDDLDGADVGSGRYEVSLELGGSSDAGASLAVAWGALGSGVLVREIAGGVVEASVRTDDIGAVIEAAIIAGCPRRIRVADTAADARG